MDPQSPSPRVFTALLSGNVKLLTECSENELRPFLPSLARMILSSTTCPTPVTMAMQWENKKKVIHTLISGMVEVNAIREYLVLDFKELKQDAKREQQLLKKLTPGESRPQSQSILASSLQFGLAIEFERSDHQRRFRLFLSEILRVLSHLDRSGPFKVVQSDLFECEVHLDEVGDILCVAAAELPDLLSVVQLSEGLLCLEKGPELLAKMVANMPDCFNQVVTHLVLNGETLDEVSLSGRCRASSIKMLCSMHPTQSTYVQSLAVGNCKHPTLALWLALEAEKKKAKDPAVKITGVVTLLHNIIIAGDDQKRAWFSQYLKCMQQKYRRHRLSAVTLLRVFLMKKLCSFLKKPTTNPVPLIMRDSATPLSHQTSEESMDEDGEDNTPSKQEDTDEQKMANEIKEPFSDTLEDLVDQMEIEISDHEEQTDESVAQKEGVASQGESSTATSNTSKVKGQPKVEVQLEPERRVPQRRRQRRLSNIDRIDFQPISIDYQLSDDDIIELMELLRVCCGLKTQTMMYLKEEEAGAILSLIVSTCPPFSPAGVSFIETTLCVLLACPFLISADDCETAVVSWFKWLLDKLPEFDRACGGHCSYGELLLLIAIHLREGQHDQIKELITDTLHMKVSGTLKSGHFITVRKLFLNVFSEDVVCAHAVSVPPTVSLSGLMTGYLPIHCVHQLVKTRTFRKHGIPIKDWIYEQLLTMSEPLHPILASLLQEFVHSIILSSIMPRSTSVSTYGNAGRTPVDETIHKPFSAEEVLSVFKDDPTSASSKNKTAITSQIIMFYYLLLYQDCYHANLKALLSHSHSPGSSTPGAYSPAVTAKIPVMFLLNYAQRHQPLYSNIYPTLLKLTATQFPQLCLVCELLTERKSVSESFKPVASISCDKVNPESAKEILQNLQTRPSQALLLLTHLTTLPPSTLTLYTHTILSTLTLLLDSRVPRRIQDLYVTLWTKLNAITPRRLLLQTVNTLRPADMAHLRPYTHQNIAEDPLIVLRCDERVLRCPPLFDIVLRMIAVSTTYSSTWLREHSYTQNCAASAAAVDVRSSPVEEQVMKQQREELCNALIAAQESAIIQMLLEICLPNDKDKEEELCFGSQMSVLQEIRCLFCSYLHHTFICQPSLVKLVHFQGYPTKLLPMMVSGVPSVHICLDFIPELLAQPQIEKQQFGVQLAAHVIHQYPLPEVMVIAEDIFKRLMILTNEIPDDLREQYFLPLLPSVVQLCQTFPPLCSEATKFLIKLSKTCTNSSKSVTNADTGSTNSPLGKVSCGNGTSCSAMDGSLATAVKDSFEELIRCAVVKV